MNSRAIQRHCPPRATLLPQGLLLAIWIGLPGLAGAQLQLSLQLQPMPTVTIIGATGTACQVQWGDDLAERGRWFHLAHRTLTNGTSVTDTNPSPFGPRFYRAVQVPNTNMVLIPGGTFIMGDSFTDGPASERPTRALTLSGFYFDQCEVSKGLWDAVSQWALTNGYSFDNLGAGKASTHPVQTVSWYDVVKWCNARAEREGRTPAYYTSASQTTVYRSGQLNLTNECVNWSVNGYRLPTEAEWECAARGGADGLRFPRGDFISHADGNFFAATYLSYDTTGLNSFHPAFSADAPPYTSPCGWFAPNAYGLYDLTGNVWEWCWDSFDGAWYANPAATQHNTRGPAGFSGERVLRGGSWFNDASFARNASRTYSTYSPPVSAADVLGFRSAITAPTMSGQPVAPARITEMARLPGGAFRFTISNLTPGRINVVAASTNLQQWTPVWTNVPVAAAVAFTNTSPSAAKQFFRTWQVP